MGCSSSTPKTKNGEKKLAVVFGATGNQGGAVARALATESSFKVRCVSRNPDSDKAKVLKEKGCEIVKADFTVKEEVQSAISGAQYVFLVTTFWENYEQKVPGNEVEQGKMVIDIARESKVEFLVFSSLERAKEKYELDIPPFEAKGEINDYLDTLEDLPHASLLVPFYYENLKTTAKPKKQDDGTYALTLPLGDAKINMMSVEDMGECVKTVFKNTSKYDKQRIELAGDIITVEHMCETLNQNFEGKKFVDGKMTPEAMEKMDFPGASIFANMFRMMIKQEDRLVEKSKELNADIQSFEKWLNTHKEELQTELFSD